MFDRARKGQAELYVRRVYITDDAELMPSYLRFVRGVVDSEDLPLNISREMLQNNPQVAQIRKALTSRVIAELETLAEKDAETFRKDLGHVRPGPQGRHLRGSRAARADARARAFHHHTGEGPHAQAIRADLQPNQTDIYYLAARARRLKSNPKLEAARARGIEVLLLTDPVDASGPEPQDTRASRSSR